MMKARATLNTLAALLLIPACVAWPAMPVRAAQPTAVNPPNWGSQQLDGSDSTAHDHFGNAVAISGSLAIVGAAEATIDGKQQQGAAYIFHRQNGTWVQIAKLVASDGQARDFFGYSVALNGNTALIGAWDRNGDRVDGGAYLFRESNGSWIQTAKLIPPAADGSAAQTWFGYAVALAGPDTALVGAPDAPNCDTQGNNCISGAVYVYHDNNGAWPMSQKFTGNETQWGSDFGNAIALSDTTAIIGESHANDCASCSQQGAAYIFKMNNGVWTQSQRLMADIRSDDDYFGNAVALNGDTALVGAIGSTINGVYGSGAAYVFVKSGGSWHQIQKLHGEQGPGSQESGISFGTSLAIDGTRALIGAPTDSLSNNDEQGTAYLFTRSGCTWNQARRFSLGSSAVFEDAFGSAVALQENLALIGAPGRRVNSNPSEGAAWIFSNNDTLFADGFDNGACP